MHLLVYCLLLFAMQLDCKTTKKLTNKFQPLLPSFLPPPTFQATTPPSRPPDRAPPASMALEAVIASALHKKHKERQLDELQSEWFNKLTFPEEVVERLGRNKFLFVDGRMVLRADVESGKAAVDLAVSYKRRLQRLRKMDDGGTGLDILQPLSSNALLKLSYISSTPKTSTTLQSASDNIKYATNYYQDSYIPANAPSLPVTSGGGVGMGEEGDGKAQKLCCPIVFYESLAPPSLRGHPSFASKGGGDVGNNKSSVLGMSTSIGSSLLLSPSFAHPNNTNKNNNQYILKTAESSGFVDMSTSIGIQNPRTPVSGFRPFTSGGSAIPNPPLRPSSSSFAAAPPPPLLDGVTGLEIPYRKFNTQPAHDRPSPRTRKVLTSPYHPNRPFARFASLAPRSPRTGRPHRPRNS